MTVLKLFKSKNCFLSKEEIISNIENKSLHNIPIYIYESTDSTNTRAKLFAEENPECKAAVFIASHQTAGRGRLGRTFESDRDKGIYISFLSQGENATRDATIITAKASVDVVKAIDILTGYTPKIKWVNDIIANGKKLAGILTEGKVDPAASFLEYSVCGIGINLYRRTFSKEISDIATTLEDVTGLRVSPSRLAGVLINEFYTQKEKEEFIEEYRKNSCVIGTRATIRRLSGEVFDADVIGIEDDGALLLKHPNGNTERIISAEVLKSRFF